KHTHSDRKPPLGVFLATTVLVFFCTLSVADSIGFVPYYIDGTAPATASTDSSVELSHLPQLGLPTHPERAGETASASTVVPTHISIPAVGIDLPVQNPSTRDITALDALLPSGPARYVDSAHLGDSGNVLIFAHSSRLPIVHNQMFRAFNNIPNLQAGDMITLTGSDGKSYTYRVTSVKRKTTTSGALIDLSRTQGTKLTLVTCDTLTGKTSRFVLTADFVGIEH
ncbi:MAG: sortase, partial [Nitrososphaera sp.]|nr:sortase [Nitrososphaera sp.]